MYEVIVGKRGIKLNEGLIRKQGLNEESIDKLLVLHKRKLEIYQFIETIEDEEALRVFAKHITDLEFNLQETWGFPKNAKFHRFWETPKCTCPKMDNEDAYPTGYYVISGDCPLHGSK